MTTTQRKSKNNPFQLSYQVKQILHANGLSKIFNWSDYEYFKRRANTAFNKAQAIADFFIQENNEQKSDFAEYLF